MKFRFLPTATVFCLLSLPLTTAHSIFDATLEMQYFGGSVTGASTGNTSYNPKFSGYNIKPGIHFNYKLADLILGVGPTISIPSIKNRELAATTISDTVTAFRYGGEIYARWQVSKHIQPYFRFEIGKDNFKETSSGYPTITSGPSAGTVDTSQIAEVKFSYGTVYYVIGAGLQSEILPYLDGFIFAGYSFSGKSVPEVQSFTLNGTPISNYTVNGTFSYTAFQIGGGLMFRY